MQTEFQILAELGDRLEKTKSRNSMVEFAADFLRSLSPEEIEPAISMILGRSFPKRESKTLEISWTTVSEIIKKLINVDQKQFTEIFGKTGDLGTTIKTVFESGKIRKQETLVKHSLTILEVRRTLKAIAETSGTGSRARKERLLETLLGSATPLESKYLVKILIGEMRTGFHEGLMELAVSKAFDVPQELVRKADMITGDIGKVAKAAKLSGIKGVSEFQVQLFQPLKPMLAQTAVEIKDVFEQHDGKSAFEYKLDGARVQIHVSKEKVKIFSRRLTDVTNSFPEIVQEVQKQIKADTAILEGELIAVDEDNTPLPFQHLMRRFRRVRDIDAMVNKIPIQLQLFDLIYLNGRSLIDDSYIDRRKQLETTAGNIHLVKQKITANQNEAETFLKKALDSGHEGLLAKKLSSMYSPGIRGKHWFKIKPSLEPLDLVIVGAEYGYGRRHDWLSDYYLAARDPETGEFLLVGKTFKGLTDEELIEMTKRLKELTITKEHRKVNVIPRIVVEVTYDEVQESPKYKSGLALRFARITRIRYDKSPEDSDTILKVKKIYERQFEKKARYLQ